MKAKSLSFRLLFSAAIILTIAFALMAFILEQGFRESAEQALKEKLQVQIYALLSLSELNSKEQLKITDNLHEPRLESPGSGLYAFVQKKDGILVWRSPSALGKENALFLELQPGESVFSANKTGQFTLQYGVLWESETGKEHPFVFTVAEEAEFLHNQVDRFKITLRNGLMIVGLVLLLVQFVVLRWGLKPLRIIGENLKAIEQGKQQQLKGRYPSELQAIASNINGLINSERAHQQRYRNTLADLAHSLKTPLAIMRGSMEELESPIQVKTTLQTQVSRMDEIVEYQLQRATAKGQRQIKGRIDLVPIVEKIVASLKKVYAEKQLSITLDMPESCWIQCEEGDLYEIIGNLLDNACKWCNQQVKLTVQGGGNSSLVNFSVEDDGPGIAKGRITDILRRGVRADQNIHGHGIGLAMVNELITLLDGQLEGGSSKTLGGLRWQVSLK